MRKRCTSVGLVIILFMFSLIFCSFICYADNYQGENNNRQKSKGNIKKEQEKEMREWYDLLKNKYNVQSKEQLQQWWDSYKIDQKSGSDINTSPILKDRTSVDNSKNNSVQSNTNTTNGTINSKDKKTVDNVARNSTNKVNTSDNNNSSNQAKDSTSIADADSGDDIYSKDTYVSEEDDGTEFQVSDSVVTGFSQEEANDSSSKDTEGTSGLKFKIILAIVYVVILGLVILVVCQVIRKDKFVA